MAAELAVARNRNNGGARYSFSADKLIGEWGDFQTGIVW
jgi:hypothetical protein